MNVLQTIPKSALILLSSALFNGLISLNAQSFDHADSLRGTYGPTRDWWDVTKYDLHLRPDIQEKTIQGLVGMEFKVLRPATELQIDLQPPLHIDSVKFINDWLTVRKDGNAHFITLPSLPDSGSLQYVEIWYSGTPRAAKRPPWDGGISWETDEEDRPFIATSCQGIGASLWWPNKDHPLDEPDSLHMYVTTPDTLMNVSNGQLLEAKAYDDGTKTWHWYVQNPINNYGININIGNYTSWSEIYEGENGPLQMSYYVLKQHEKEAREQFTQARDMMEAFEHWFGPYPFYEDGFKLVEVPYLGMEHQSSVTYGNRFMNGYLGRDLSSTGVGLSFDFIIVHESGHEWFANNITAADNADMWLHEGFTNYSESLFIEYHQGKEKAATYVRGTRSLIQNAAPIVGPYGVNTAGSGDMYYKGGNLLHTLRQVVNDDLKWREMFREMNRHFRHQTVTTAEIESFISTHLNLDLDYYFDQYVRDIRVPSLTYYWSENKLMYRWNNCVEQFQMPIEVHVGEQYLRITPNVEWQILEFDNQQELIVYPDYYVSLFKIR